MPPDRHYFDPETGETRLATRRERLVELVGDYWTLGVQVLAFLTVCIGIAMWSIPSALIVGGIGVIAVFEIPRSPNGPTITARRRRAPE